MSVEMIEGLVARRLNASADRDSKERLTNFMANISHASHTCGTLRRTGLAERAVELAAAGGRFTVAEVNAALDKTAVLSGVRGDKSDTETRLAFKVGLQQLGLL